MKKYLIINSIILLLAMAFSVAVGLFLIFEFDIGQAKAASLDKEPPVIYNPGVSDVTASSAMITWTTDEEADSLVNFGLNKRYGMVRDPFYDKTEHSILVDDLLPDTVYYFRITSADDSGNQTISSDYTFTTLPIQEYIEKEIEEGLSPGRFDEEGEFEQKFEEEGMFEKGFDEEGLYEYPYMEELEEAEEERVTEILEKMQEVTAEEALEAIKKTVEYQAEQVSEFEIIFDQVDVETGTDYAVVRWRTSQEANSIISLVEERDFDPNAADPYFWEEGNFQVQTKEHRVEVTGLDPATTYHFKVSSETSLGVSAESEDLVFVTKSILPEIYNLSVYKIEEDAATITFNTNVPCSSLVEYTNLDTADTKMEGSSDYGVAHSVRLTNLNYDTYYSALVEVENEYGEKAQSSPFTFLTIKDETEPMISKVRTESTLYPGGDTKVQTIISWETDELAVCQLFYHQGLATGEDINELEIEEDYIKKHVQVTTNLLPSTVYKYWIKCWDDVKNEARSRDFSMLTPTREESIIDIILKNFESTFGWVKNIGGGG